MTAFLRFSSKVTFSDMLFRPIDRKAGMLIFEQLCQKQFLRQNACPVGNIACFEGGIIGYDIEELRGSLSLSVLGYLFYLAA